MVSLGHIYQVLDAHDVLLQVYPIGFTLAATLQVNNRYAVFCDPSVMQNTAALKACLAHECGHCATGATHELSSPWELVAKHEYKANRYAYDTFLPYEALCAAVRGGCTEPWQLAEHFDVPQKFVEAAITYYATARRLYLPSVG